MTAFLPRHLSVSSVQTYAACPAAWKARYIDRLVQPSSSPMMFGSVFHKTLEAEHRGWNSERALVSAWNTGDAILADAGLSLHPGKAHALALLDEYKRQGLGGVLGQPERKFELRLLVPSVPVPVLGYIDLPIPERRRFREFKTTSSTTRWTHEKVMLEYQLHTYGRAYQDIYHHRVECAEYVIFGTDSVRVEVIEAVPSPDGFRLFEMAAAETWNGIKAGKFTGCGKQDCDVCCRPPAEKPARPAPSFTWEEATP
jgi:hypothetical protein